MTTTGETATSPGDKEVCFFPGDGKHTFRFTLNNVIAADGDGVFSFGCPMEILEASSHAYVSDEMVFAVSELCRCLVMHGGVTVGMLLCRPSRLIGCTDSIAQLIDKTCSSSIVIS